MTTQLYLGIGIVVLIGLYFFLKMKWGKKAAGLPAVSQTTPPAVSEDANLPVQKENPPAEKPDSGGTQ